MDSSGDVFLDSNLRTLTTETKRRESTFSRKKSIIGQRGRLPSMSMASISTGQHSQFKSRSSTFGLGNSLQNHRQSFLVKSKPFENTYKIGPETDEQPLVSVVKNAAHDVIKGHVDNVDYDEELSGKLACDLSVIIKQRVKMSLPCVRYKVTCNVLVTQPVGQGVQTSSRCLWNEETDSYTSVVYENKKIHIVAIIHWIYFD